MVYYEQDSEFTQVNSHIVYFVQMLTFALLYFVYNYIDCKYHLYLFHLILYHLFAPPLIICRQLLFILITCN